jgi:hypothetical protein
VDPFASLPAPSSEPPAGVKPLATKPATPLDTSLPPKMPTTPGRSAALRDAPTWAQVLAELPMHKDGRTREHEIAFDIIKEITGKKKAPKFDDLTPEQKGELYERVKALKPAPVDIAKRADQIMKGDPNKFVAFNDAELDANRQIDANFSLKKWPKEAEDAAYAAARKAFLNAVVNRDSLLEAAKAAEEAVRRLSRSPPPRPAPTTSSRP